ncbi:alpha/beta fold hydrolase [Streptomyces sp. H27-D2]|uniref:alpha/beta fold hydrolase n=1 Tax=Streptomyces sp. H27-D2 TaxID=3046304 RepID=UPI002DB98785|nr:alpha/beta hydrolase [Streptomyces sp. H27-D2]MEC4016447.1 alpha/beta hydrolase [Streptomyces sp. H27-D2]
MDNEKIVHANGVDLCVETFGDPTDPAILLISGAASSMDSWEDRFCERLAAGTRYVIRYDSRDTGRSTSYKPGAPPYSVPDLAADAVGLLDALSVRRAHIVGISMGGGIAQRLAVERPGRVASVTLISTSPGGPGRPGTADDSGLPPMSEKLRAHFAQRPPAPDWSDRTAVIDYRVESLRRLVGSAGFDEARARELAGLVFDRTPDMATGMNHGLLDAGDPIRPRLSEVTAPTLVIHGTEDPVFPYGHAEALAAEITDARLLPLPGVGHQMLPETTWNAVVPTILRHTGGTHGEPSDRRVSRAAAAAASGSGSGSGDPRGWF